MRYINTKTGAVIDSSFAISGGDWTSEDKIPRAVEAPNEPEVVEPPKADESPKSEPVTALVNPTGAGDAYDSITVAQIKQELDAFGVEYDKRANKQALYDLMMSQGK